MPQSDDDTKMADLPSDKIFVPSSEVEAATADPDTIPFTLSSSLQVFDDYPDTASEDAVRTLGRRIIQKFKEEYEKQAAILEGQNARLEFSLRDASANASLAAQSMPAKAKLEKLEKSEEDYNRLIADNLALSRELTHKEILADEATKRLDDARKLFEEKEAIKRYTTANKKILGENKALKASNKDLENDPRDVNGVLQGPEGASKDAKTLMIDQLQNYSAKFVGAVSDLRDRIIDCDEEIEGLRKQKSSLEEENENLKRDGNSTSGKKAVHLSSSDPDVGAQIMEYESQNADLKKQVAEMRARVNALTGDRTKGALKTPSSSPRKPAAKPATTSYVVLENDEELVRDLSKQVELITQQEYNFGAAYTQTVDNIMWLENDGLSYREHIDKLLKLRAAITVPSVADEIETVSFDSDTVLRNYQILAGNLAQRLTANIALISQLNMQIDTLTRENRNLKKKSTVTKPKIVPHVCKDAAHKKVVEGLNTEINNLQTLLGDVEDNKSQLKTLQKKIDNLKAQVKKLKADNAGLEKKLEKCQDASEEGGDSDKITALEDGIGELKQKKNKLDHEIAEANANLHVREAQIKSIYEGVKKQIFDLVAENKYLKSELEYAKDVFKVKQNEALKDKLRKKDDTHSKNLQNRIDSLDQQLQDTHNELESHNNAFKDYEFQVEADRVKASEIIADLEANFQEYEDEKIANAESYTESSEESRLKRDLTDTKKELADCDKALGDLNTQYKADMARDAAIIKDLEARVKACNEEKSAISRVKKGEHTPVDPKNLQDKIAKLEQKLKDFSAASSAREVLDLKKNKSLEDKLKSYLPLGGGDPRSGGAGTNLCVRIAQVQTRIDELVAGGKGASPLTPNRKRKFADKLTQCEQGVASSSPQPLRSNQEAQDIEMEMSTAAGLERQEPKEKEELAKAEAKLEALCTESKALIQQGEYLKAKDLVAQGERLKSKQALDDCNQKLVNVRMEQVQTKNSQAQPGELEAEIIARQKNVNDFEKKIRKLEERIKELGNEAEVAEKQITLLRTKCNKRDNEVTALGLEREELRTQIDTLQAKLKTGAKVRDKRPRATGANDDDHENYDNGPGGGAGSGPSKSKRPRVDASSDLIMGEESDSGLSEGCIPPPEGNPNYDQGVRHGYLKKALRRLEIDIPRLERQIDQVKAMNHNSELKKWIETLVQAYKFDGEYITKNDILPALKHELNWKKRKQDEFVAESDEIERRKKCAEEAEQGAFEDSESEGTNVEEDEEFEFQEQKESEEAEQLRRQRIASKPRTRKPRRLDPALQQLKEWEEGAWRFPTWRH